jgi:hypothetical protein
MAQSTPMVQFLLRQGEKALRSPEGLKEACAGLTAPSHHLNYLLDSEIHFHRQVILKIINRIGQEMPEEFQAEGIFVEFYKSAIQHLQSSEQLAIFQDHEIPAVTELRLEDAVEQIDARLCDIDDRIKQAVTNGELRDGEPVIEEETSCQVLTHYPTEDIRSCLSRLDQSRPHATVYIKGARLMVKGRVFDNISLDARLRGVLPRVTSAETNQATD